MTTDIDIPSNNTTNTTSSNSSNDDGNEQKQQDDLNQQEIQQQQPINNTNTVLQTICMNLQQLRNRLLENQNKNKQLFNMGIEVIKAQTNKSNITTTNNDEIVGERNENVDQQQQQQQQKQQESEEYIKLQKKEQEEYNLNQDKQIQQLQNEIENLHKVISVLEGENKHSKASYNDMKASLDTIIEKGRVQMKSLQTEKFKNTELQNQIVVERNHSDKFKKENLLLKSKIQEMMFLLQKSTEEDDYYQNLAKELYYENANLRELLKISDTFENSSLIDEASQS